MPRVKRGTIASKRRRKVLKRAKGYRFGRSTKEREAKVATIKAGQSAYRHRREKKRERRGWWQTKIGAAARIHGLSYSQLMAKLKKANSGLDRKILAELAEKRPAAWASLIKQVI